MNTFTDNELNNGNPDCLLTNIISVEPIVSILPKDAMLVEDTEITFDSYEDIKKALNDFIRNHHISRGYPDKVVISQELPNMYIAQHNIGFYTIKPKLNEPTKFIVSIYTNNRIRYGGTFWNYVEYHLEMFCIYLDKTYTEYKHSNDYNYEEEDPSAAEDTSAAEEDPSAAKEETDLQLNSDDDDECPSLCIENPESIALAKGILPAHEDEDDEDDEDEDEDEDEHDMCDNCCEPATSGLIGDKFWCIECREEYDESNLSLSEMDDYQVERYVESIGREPRDEIDEWNTDYTGLTLDFIKNHIARYSYGNFTNATICEHIINDSDGMTITGAIFKNTTFNFCTYKFVTFKECDFTDCKIVNCDFRLLNFVNCINMTLRLDNSCHSVDTEYDNDNE